MSLTRRTLLKRGAGAAAMAATLDLTALAARRDADYRLGFESLRREVTLPRLEVDGRLPDWLSGTLVRNGPAQFEVGERSFEHWFDGLAMLHAFSFARGRVSYRNRFLRSSAYEAARREGTIRYSEFATDPCRAIFNGAQSMFAIAPKPNANVNVAQIARRFVALTEIPMPVRFDPQLLRTLGVSGEVPFAQLGTAHPHRTRSERITYEVKLLPPAEYHVRAQRGRRVRTVAQIPVEQPAYMHSFGLTDRYVVLGESPFAVDPLKLATDWEPFIRNYRWTPSRGARFIVVDRRSGRSQTFETDPFFTFHHVNAFEKGNRICVDLIGYDDADLIDALYLERLRGPGRAADVGELRRYEIDLGRRRVRRRELVEPALELPRLNYARANGGEYRYVYGTGLRNARTSGFIDQLVKADVRSGEARIWRERGCFPGEAVFVPSPRARREDDGVALSVVLDTRRRRSFLLVLDARSFTEVARAEVPHHIPFGFHGELFRV